MFTMANEISTELTRNPRNPQIEEAVKFILGAEEQFAQSSWFKSCFTLQSEASLPVHNDARTADHFSRDFDQTPQVREEIRLRYFRQGFSSVAIGSGEKSYDV